MSFKLPEKITIWNEVSDDGGGGKTWTRSGPHKARHATKAERFRDMKGQITMSKLVVYSKATELVVGAFVLIGESSSDAPVTGTEEVRAVTGQPGTLSLKRALL